MDICTEIHHELYDHKFDKLENINLVKNTAYQDTLILKLTLNKRIEEARKNQMDWRQFENAKPTFEPVRIRSSKKSTLLHKFQRNLNSLAQYSSLCQ